IDSINVLPAKEIALTDEGIARFRAGWREKFAGNPGQCPVYRDVSQGLAPAGIEYYLPLFYQETNTLFDYVADDSIFILDEDVRETMEGFWKDVEDRYEQARHDIERPILPPRDLYLTEQDLFTRIKPFTRIHVTSMAQEEHAHAVNYATSAPVQLPIDARLPEPLGILKRYIDEFNGRLLIAAESTGRRETLLEMFRQHDL